MATPATHRSCRISGAVALVFALASGCARPSSPPATHVVEVPPSASAARAPPTSATAAATQTARATGPDDDATVKVRFYVLDQELRKDPKTGQERFHTTLELVADTQPPQRLLIGRLNEPGCRLAYHAAELDDAPRVKGGLVCYYAGYGDYVRVADDGAGRLSVSTFGQSEALSGNENPPHEHERMIGRLAVPPGRRLVFELVELDAGALP